MKLERLMTGLDSAPTAAPTMPTSAPAPARASTAARILVGLPDGITAAATGLCVPLMVLLLAAQFRPALTLPLGLAGAALAVWSVRGGAAATTVAPSSRGLVWSSAGAVLFAAGWLAYNVRYAAQDVYITRDPATYTITARWLVDHGSVVIHAQPEVFGSPAHGEIASGSFAMIGPDTLNAQGNHLFPAVLGFAGSICGSGAVFTTNAVIGALALLVLFGLARRLLGGPAALVVMVGFGICMPFVYVSRDTYTEPLTMLFLVGGLALIHRAYASWLLRDFAIAGLAAGSAAMVRIDSYPALAGIVAAAFVFAAIAPAGRRSGALTRSLVLLAGAAATALLGWLDLVRLSQQYYDSLHGTIVTSLVGVLAALAAAVPLLWLAWRPAVGEWLTRPSVRLAGARGAVLVLCAVFLALAFRPLWQTTHGSRNLNLENMQRTSQVAVDGTRTYHEQTVHWLALYVGWPTVVAAVIGYAWMLVHLVCRRRYQLAGVLAVGLSMSALYLWNSEIAPDQPWASRRYVPVVLPLIAVAAGYGLRALWRAPRWRVLLRPVVAAVVVYGLVFTGATTYPMRHVRDENPQRTQLSALCRGIGRDGAVLLLDENAVFGYGQALRSFCGVPVLGLVDATAEEIRTVNSAVLSHGRHLFVLSQLTDAASLAQVTRSTGLKPTTYQRVVVQRWPTQIDVAPNKSDVKQVYSMFLASVDASGTPHVVPSAGTAGK
jgi:dolichyl-phosphate-mannose-protein mannosyltransferase